MATAIYFAEESVHIAEEPAVYYGFHLAISGVGWTRCPFLLQDSRTYLIQAIAALGYASEVAMRIAGAACVANDEEAERKAIEEAIEDDVVDCLRVPPIHGVFDFALDLVINILSHEKTREEQATYFQAQSQREAAASLERQLAADEAAEAEAEEQDAELDDEDERQKYKLWKRQIAKLPRDKIVTLLTDIGIACYDHESDALLQEALFENIKDGNIDPLHLVSE